MEGPKNGMRLDKEQTARQRGVEERGIRNRKEGTADEKGRISRKQNVVIIIKGRGLHAKTKVRAGKRGPRKRSIQKGERCLAKLEKKRPSKT